MLFPFTCDNFVVMTVIFFLSVAPCALGVTSRQLTVDGDTVTWKTVSISRRYIFLYFCVLVDVRSLRNLISVINSLSLEKELNTSMK